MTPVTTTPTIGTQYRRLPTQGTKLAIKLGQKSRSNFTAAGYQNLPETVRQALRNGQFVTAVSQSDEQFMDYGPVSGLSVNGQSITGTFNFQIRDLFRLA